MLVEKLLKVALLGSEWVMYLLLALSVFSIATMFERLIFFKKRNDDIDELGEKLIAALEQNDRARAEAILKASKSVEATVLMSALRYLDAGPEAVEDAITASMIREKRDLDRGSTLLGTLGNNAPFIGLMGTVIGVIIAFRRLGESQAANSMSAVMGGIAESLVATGVGLFVAIPAVVAYNIIQKSIADIEDNVASLAKELTALLKGKQHGAQSSGLRSHGEPGGSGGARDLSASPGTN
jgi:biopolymer transport protein ExbB/biopolymer transport protein TolQ